MALKVEKASSREKSNLFVTREAYLAEPKKYARLANKRRRVFVQNAEGAVILVIGGHLDH